MQPERAPLYLNHFAITSPLGVNAAQVLEHLLEPPANLLRPYGPLVSGKTVLVGQVCDPLPHLPEYLVSYQTRNNQLLLSALSQIAKPIAAAKKRYGADRIAIILGTSTSGIADGEMALTQQIHTGNWPDDYNYTQQEIGHLSAFAATYLGLTGVSYTISTACSSSGKVLASAQRLLHADLADMVIVGGCDTLSGLTLNGFDGLESLATDICLPFSPQRDGINIGEAAALACLSKVPSEIQLLGVGEASDGFHISSPDPQGRGAELAIQQALEQAKVTPAQIGYINLHGTATIKNDAMESRLINRIFGTNTPCSSTKPLTGHALGAAGAQEWLLCALLLSSQNPRRILPQQQGSTDYDPDLPPIGLIRQAQTWQSGIFMSNSFAFGGSNVSVIIGRHSLTPVQTEPPHDR
ncbi:beta-ketoacyl-[acyl-carrier-protein] synthase family protein [Motilimonas cestriensis]|uniref:beta-ketoacyl-[acyl-carrier-protein] synthase family protein n=1 Tax=Motilimonas cestriensis TaxID=2742685 RepID=UPI003DA3B1C7